MIGGYANPIVLLLWREGGPHFRQCAGAHRILIRHWHDSIRAMLLLLESSFVRAQYTG